MGLCVGSVGEYVGPLEPKGNFLMGLNEGEKVTNVGVCEGEYVVNVGDFVGDFVG